MSIAFGISYAILWVVVIVEGICIAALFYHSGRTLITDLSRAQAHGPEIGSTAPVGTHASIEGAPVRIGGRRATEQALLFVASQCNSCKLSLETVGRSIHPVNPVQVIVICQGPAEDVHRLADTKRLHTGSVIADERGAVARQWDVVSVPFLVVIGPDGRVVRRGNPSSDHRLRELMSLGTVPPATPVAAPA